MLAVKMSNLSSRQHLQITKIIGFPDYSNLSMNPLIEEEKKSPYRSGFGQGIAVPPGSQGVPQS